MLTNILIHLKVLQIMLKLCNHIHSFVVAEFWKCALLVIFDASNSGNTTFVSSGVLGISSM